MNLRIKAQAMHDSGEPLNPRVMVWMRDRPEESRAFECRLFFAAKWAEFRAQPGGKRAGDISTAEQAAFDVWLGSDLRLLDRRPLIAQPSLFEVAA